MKHTVNPLIPAGCLLLCVLSCRQTPALEEPVPVLPELSLPGVAGLLAAVPTGPDQLREVHSAVRSSSANGYDEEYTMRDLFSTPGAGVGDDPSATRALALGTPLRDVIEDYLRSSVATKSSGTEDVDGYIRALASSDMQIYWPFSESWDGESSPIVTFDPGIDTGVNSGYEVAVSEDGRRSLREVQVTEDMARTRPVWVVNTNDDSAFKSLEMYRKENPDWGRGGGAVVRSADVRSLVLKDFTMKRHYDSWFRGASEFFVRTGCVEGFTASTEAEMRLYSPSITDFMVVVKRSNLGVTIPFNAMLISDWTDQLESFAFLITEDDGGTRTSWKTEAVVKVNSKSYGVVIDLPFNIRDDIVWRGSISNRFMSQYSGKTAHFGDVDITFEIQ